MRLTESSVRLVDGFDPPDWATWPVGDDDPEDDGAWDKVGGTPRWLQGDETPDGDGWRFWFQYTAARIGFELADGAECYGSHRSRRTRHLHRPVARTLAAVAARRAIAISRGPPVR